MYDHLKVFELLDNKLKFISENSKEFVFRCPYCGDSSNPNHGHLYVSKEEPVFHCKRCGAGVGKNINSLLNYLNLPTIDLGSSALKKTITIYNDDNNNEQIYAQLSDDNLIPKYVKYVSKRLGVRSTEIYDNLNAISFLNPDYIDNLGIFYNFPNNGDYYRQFIKDGNTVSFVTWNKQYIINRVLNFNSYVTKRYITLRLIEKSIEDLYVVRDRNIKNKKIENIIVAEGILDILGLYFYLKDEYYPENTLWIAVLGNTYIRGVRFANNNFFLPYKSVKLKVFMDNDGGLLNNIDQFKKKIDSYNDLFMANSIEFYINVLHKDYGYHRIKLSRIEQL